MRHGWKTTQITQQRTWPAEYRNRERGKVYAPHHDAEREAVYSDAPRYQLFKGGEGGGKSVAGIVKVLNRIRRGMSGIMVSPDLPHFKKSLWPEFQRWCPWEQVIDSQQYRGAFSWEPNQAFTLAFKNEAVLYCGGIEEPMSWEGPNVNFAHMDEARRAKDASALKVLDGRCRIPGTHGEPSQLWFTTTPRKNWLFEFFGPLKDDDLHASFKNSSDVVTLLTRDNETNLEPGYEKTRRQSLTEQEARVLLEAEWEDIDEADRFLPSMVYWDTLKEALPIITRREPMVLAMDAATGRIASVSDCFGTIGVTRHPTRHDDVAVRFVMKWQARPGGEIDFQGSEQAPGPERIIRRLCKDLNIVEVCFDPTQLHDMYKRLSKEGLTHFEKFEQGTRRAQSDKMLYDVITQKRLAHDGNADLRAHIDNADGKTDSQDKKLRIVKREDGLKIDLAVCLSMATLECLRLNL
jgi:hypothetical protein